MTFVSLQQIEYFRAHMTRSFPRNPSEFLKGCYCMLFSAELQYDYQLCRVCSFWILFSFLANGIVCLFMKIRNSAFYHNLGLSLHCRRPPKLATRRCSQATWLPQVRRVRLMLMRATELPRAGRRNVWPHLSWRLRRHRRTTATTRSSALQESRTSWRAAWRIIWFSPFAKRRKTSGLTSANRLVLSGWFDY